MQKMILKNGAIAAAAVFALLLSIPVIVSAQTDKAQEVRQSAQDKREAAQLQKPDNHQMHSASEHVEKRHDKTNSKLDAAKLKSCQNRAKSIQNIMSRMSDRGNRQLDVFTKIADRTQAFYAEKGASLSNYDALVSQVSLKKEAAELAANDLKDSSVEFRCDSENPKASIETFKEKKKAMIAALKEYKTAVKNLIVGVKSAQGSAQGSSNTSEGAQQ